MNRAMLTARLPSCLRASYESLFCGPGRTTRTGNGRAAGAATVSGPAESDRADEKKETATGSGGPKSTW